MSSANGRQDKKPLIYEPYICRLTKEQKTFVEVEFFEVDEIRDKWIADVRHWVIKHPDIHWCRLDGLFLLQFLRYSKFARWCEAPILAKEALLRYLAMRQIYPEWCRGLDPHDESMQKMLDDEVFTILGKDTAGQMIVWIRLGRFDVNNLDPIVLLRYTIMFLELMAEHEPVQIAGIKVWVDYKDTNWRHFLRYNFDLLREFKKVVEKVIPVWIREVHNVGLPEIASPYRTFLCNLGIELFKYKTYWHRWSVEAKEYFEVANWPEEYGGQYNSTRQAGYLKRWFEEKREKLLSLDQMDIDVGLHDIRYFKPYYEGPGNTGASATMKFESMVNIKCEFVKKEPKIEATSVNALKSEHPDARNVKSEFAKVDVKNIMKDKAELKTGAIKKETVKKEAKNLKKKSGKPKAKRVKIIKIAKNEVKSDKRESLTAEKSNVKKPWK